MKVLQSILSESKEYYIDARKKIEDRLGALPHGSVKERVIGGRKYYYLQYRLKNRVVQKYIGRKYPDDVAKQVEERRSLKKELKKVKEALKIIKRSEGRRRV